jgi:hypothetical protein
VSIAVRSRSCSRARPRASTSGLASLLRLFVLTALGGSLGFAVSACGDDAPAKSDGGHDASQSPDTDSGSDEGAPPNVERDAGSARDAGQASDAGSVRDGSTSSGEDAALAPSMEGGTGDAGPTAKRFSFFMTSQAGLTKLSGKADGFGGDLRFGKADGLSGADEICRQLAEASMPGNGKTWRAFLSVTKGPNGMPVNAIDRIGEGPWYDRREHLFAMNKAALRNPRPLGCDPTIINDFPNEDGVPNHNPGTGIIDNHNTLTGSTTMGTLDMRGLTATCQDWTNSQADGGKPRCGVSWPRASLTHWISVLDEGGCAPGATPPGAEAGTRGTVGALGGYGGFYCFALTP